MCDVCFCLTELWYWQGGSRLLVQIASVGIICYALGDLCVSHSCKSVRFKGLLHHFKSFCTKLCVRHEHLKNKKTKRIKRSWEGEALNLKYWFSRCSIVIQLLLLIQNRRCYTLLYTIYIIYNRTIKGSWCFTHFYSLFWKDTECGEKLEEK